MGENGIMQRFRGSYDVKIDDRGRIRIPSRFLYVFDSMYGNDIYITSLNGDYIMIYPVKVWGKIEAKIEGMGVFNPDLDEFSNLLSYWGTETEIDSKGRVLIPPGLRKIAEINDHARIFGKANYLIIWNEENFKEKEMKEKFSKEKLYRVSGVINEFSPLSSDE